MATIQVVENPRKKRRRRSYSAAQRRAGFGGKRSMSRRRKSRRRRNPALASVGNPRRRTYRRSRPRYTVTGVSRRRRNPSTGPLGVDLSSALYIGLGMFGSELVPRLVKKAWPGMPTTGALGYLVRGGAAVAVGFAVGKATNKRNGQLAAAGGIALVMVDLFRTYVAPRIGLSGMGGQYDLVDYGDISDVAGYVTVPSGMQGYVATNNGMEGYVQASPAGVGIGAGW